MLIKLKKAQSTAEYAILISVIVGAALAMQVYVKRSLQAKMHDASGVLSATSGDVTGDGVTLGTSRQYEPYYADQRVSSINRSVTGTSTSDTGDGGLLDRASDKTVTATSSGTEATHALVTEE